MCLIAGVDQCIRQHIGWVLDDILIDILAACRLTYWSICLLSLVEDTSRIGRVLVLYWSSIDRHIDRSLVNRWSTVGCDSIDSVSAMHRWTIGQVSVTYQCCIEWRDKPCILYLVSWVQKKIITVQSGKGKGDYPPFRPRLSGLAQLVHHIFFLVHVLSATECHSFQWENLSFMPNKTNNYYAETFSLWTDSGQGLVLTACWWYVSEQYYWQSNDRLSTDGL